MQSQTQREKTTTLAGTDSDWEEWGKSDPYYAVLSAPKFRRGALDGSALNEFFSSGSEHVDHVLSVLQRNFRSDFKPRRSLDFGCGVGRVAVPLARHSGSLTAVDISPTMLHEAARNAASQGVDNIDFLQTGELGSIAPGSLDLVHSYIVFQHIPPNRGKVLFQELLRKLKPGGLGALHLTVARNAPFAKRMIASVRRRSGIANRVANLLQNRPASGPAIYMFTYSLSNIVFSLRANGCEQMFTEFTQHSDYLGAILYFEKTSLL
ncbi:MAG TPA: methyltransferase domain-containing protein [Terracidiphilus sp.]|nr:methyltransferase domain-containing protein [Terracidiphilus sp.]